MNDFTQEALSAIKATLAGLPSFSRLAIYDLLPYCDFSTGIISIPSLDEVANTDFYVVPAPGRKKENIQSETLRNAFRTIKKSRPNDFIFSTKNQRIIIEMPFVRELYQQFHQDITDVAAVNATEVVTAKTYASIEKEAVFNTYVYTDLTAVELGSIKDLNNIKQTNKQINSTPFNKKIITPDFYPDESTIAEALGKGMTKVLDLSEIQSFINHNRKHGSQWADFNPVFIKWLERDIQLTKEKQQKTQQKQQETNNSMITRSNYHASPAHPKPFQKVISASGSSHMDRVCAHHPDIDPGTLYLEAPPMYID
jgi:hypothetical protein